MSKLTIENGQAIAEENLERIYHLPKRYTNLDEYLSGSLRETLLSILNYIKDKRLIIENHKYLFFLDTTRLTTEVRKKGGRSTSNRHINLLCALGLLGKEPQNEYRDQLIEINKIFLSKHPSAKRPINVFIVRRYTDEYLEKCEESARRLNSQHIRTGNMCSNMLIVHGLEDIAKEVYPNNNPLAPEVKTEDYQKLLGHMKAVVERQGYITKQQIFKAMDWSMEYLEQVRRIFRQDLAKVFKYYSPTNQQMKEYHLKDRKYIYTKRG